MARDIIENFPSAHAMLGIDVAELLMDCVAETDGDYIEIGSLAGGSAVMAAKAMGERPGTVYCIEPFIGMNALEGLDPLFKSFWENMLHYNVEQRIVLFNQYTPPFPMPIHFHRFSVGLIDGNHLGDWPAKDFMELDSRVTDFLLIDNAEMEYVERIVDLATHHDWEEHKTIEYASEMPSKKGKNNLFVALRRIAPIEYVPLRDKLKRYYKKGIPLC